MVSLRVSLICLLLFSGGSCFPKPEENRYPHAATWGSGGSAPGSNFPSAQAVNYQQPPHGPSAPTGNQSPSGVGAHSGVVGTSPIYEPSRVHVSSGSGSNKPSQGAGYVSPSGPAGTGSFSVQPQPSGTSGHSSVGSVGVPSSSVYGASPSYSAPAYMASSFYGAGSSGANINAGSGSNKPSQGAVYVSPSGPAGTGSFSVQPQPSGTSGHSSVGSVGVPSSSVYGASPSYSAPAYMASSFYGAPATFNYGAGSSGANINAGPATGYPADTSRYAAPAYHGASETNSGYFDASPVTYVVGAGSVPDLPWVEQPVEAEFSDPSEWMPRGDFPDFSVWQSGGFNSKMSQGESEPSPVPASTYVIQSGNGYMRALQHQSHANYAPQEAEPLLYVAEPVRAQPTKTRPAAPAKGGKKF